MSLAENIADREAAVFLLSLVVGPQRQRFWEVLRDEAIKHLPTPPPQEPPMSDADAAKFEREPMPYGKFIQMEIGDVPIGYLCRLLDPDEFGLKLRRYVKSARFLKRQED